MANASVFEVCSGSQAASAGASLIVGIGAQDSSMTGGTGVYRTPQVGDLLVVFVGSDNTSGTPNAGGVSDSKANTWTAIQTQVGAVNQQFRVFGTIIAAGKALTVSDTITATFASNAGTHHLIAKCIVGPSVITSSNGVTTQGSGGGTWSSGASGALSGTKVVCGFLQNANAGGKPSALTFDSATATTTQCPSGHWSTFMVDTTPPGAGEAAGGTTVSGTWAAGVVAWTAPTPITGTGAISLPGAPSIALAGAGVYTPPVTGTGALAARKIALAGAGTYTPPVTGTGGTVAKKIRLAGAATYTGPFSGTGSFTAKKITLAGAGTYTPQPVTGSGGLSAKKITLAGAGTYTPAPTTGTAAWHAKKPALASTGTYTPPVTGTGSWHAKKITLAGSGGVGVPTTGTGTWAAKKITLSGAGVYTTTGTAAWAAKKITLAGAGLYTPPGITGTATWAAKKIKLAGVGSLVPAITGTGSFTAKRIILTGSGIANIVPITGHAQIAAKKIQLAGVGTARAAPPAPRQASAEPPTMLPVIWSGLSLNDGQRDDELCTVVTAVEGWYGSPPLAGNDLARVLSDGALFGYKTLGPRVVAITGAATGPRDLLNAFARDLGTQAAERQPATLIIGEDDGSDSPGALTALVRADSDTLALSWQGRVYITYQVALTAADPRLYDSGQQLVTLTPLPSGAATGRTYPLAPPRSYASASVANAAFLANPGNTPAPVIVTYTGDLSESRLTDGIATIHLTALAPAQQVYVNSETLQTTAPGGASRASYLMPGTVSLTIPPGGSTWYLYGTGLGRVTLSWQATWI